MRKFLGLAALAALSACNSENTSQATSPVADPDAGKYHEAAFSFDSTTGAFAARSAAASQKFTSEEYVAALQNITENLKNTSYRDQLQKPIDYVCDDVLLAMYQSYGSIIVNDSLILDKDILKSRCVYTGESESDTLSNSTYSGRANVAADGNWDYSSTSEDRQYPYKMIGTSWNNYDFLNANIYKSTGGETSFQKRRRKYFTTAWWALDAEHIGVRIYLFNNHTSPNLGTVSVLVRSSSDFYSNSSSVSKREFAAGVVINGSFGSSNGMPNFDVMKKIPSPPSYSVNEQFGNIKTKNGKMWEMKGADFSNMNKRNLYNDFLSAINASGYPNFGVFPGTLTVSGGVISLHSVDHGGMKFRAISGSGLASTVVTNDYNSLDFVTW